MASVWTDNVFKLNTLINQKINNKFINLNTYTNFEQVFCSYIMMFFKLHMFLYMNRSWSAITESEHAGYW